MVAQCEGYTMLERLRGHIPEHSPWRRQVQDLLEGQIGRVGVHLAVFVEPYLGAILEGRKTIESRFALHRCAPYGTVEAGDVILLKRSGGPVVAVARAGRPDFFQLRPGDLEQIRLEHAKELFALDDEFWECRSEKRYATLIGLEDTLRVADMAVDKRDRRGWVSYPKVGKPSLARV